MAWIYARLDRLRQVVAECVKRGLTPQKVGFADFVLRKSSDFGLTPTTTRGYVATLIEAWNHNRWKSYIQHNDYLTEEEKEKWIQEHFQP